LASLPGEPREEDEWRRLFGELLGTFFLVLVAVGGGMVNARFGGHVIGPAALVTAPGLMVGAIILFMGSVSGAHLNPGVSLAFAMRGDFPWARVPGYIAAQFAGSFLATLLLVALLGAQGSAGLTLPGPSISPAAAMVWEAVLTVGLVSVILGTSSGAQNVGPMNATAVAGYIALAGLWGAPVSGASMNTARSLGPALVPRRHRGMVGLSRGAGPGRGERRRDRVHPARQRWRVLREKGGGGRPGVAMEARPDPPGRYRLGGRVARRGPPARSDLRRRVGAAHPHCAATSGPGGMRLSPSDALIPALASP
jgi:glycerol uptake facilitator-like aquaporin